jgi:hypothetical protein
MKRLNGPSSSVIASTVRGTWASLLLSWSAQLAERALSSDKAPCSCRSSQTGQSDCAVVDKQTQPPLLICKYIRMDCQGTPRQFACLVLLLMYKPT